MKSEEKDFTPFEKRVIELLESIDQRLGNIEGDLNGIALGVYSVKCAVDRPAPGAR